MRAHPRSGIPCGSDSKVNQRPIAQHNAMPEGLSMRHPTAKLSLHSRQAQQLRRMLFVAGPSSCRSPGVRTTKSFATSAAFPLHVISLVRPRTNKILIPGAWREGGVRPVARHRNSHTHSPGRDRDPKVRRSTIIGLYTFLHPFLATFSRKTILYSY
jgi:hypothetical protein